MISQIFLYLAATVGAMLPIVNPLSTAPVFLAVTRGFSNARRSSQARMAAIYMVTILLVSLFGGALMLTLFGISIPVLRIAGGLVIARIGFGMLEPAREQRVLPEEEEEAKRMEDVAFTPVAMPMLAGPGAIATAIAMATEASDVVHYAGIALGIIVIGAVAWVTLRSAAALQSFIGDTGMNVVTRLMGLVLVCIGIRFIAVGVIDGLTGELMTGILRDWLRELGGQA